MDARHMPNNSPNNRELIDMLGTILPPGCRTVASESFYWSPRTKTLHYVQGRLNEPTGQAALLHEAGHAMLDHQSYQLDSELLTREVEAWEQARRLAPALGLSIDDNHIEDCLDTYREWLYARSTCPGCKTSGLQIDRATYSCVNCPTRWQVSPSRFCRAYRMRSRQQKTPPKASPRTVFA